MDIVIPYVHSRQEELRFCLRSIEKYFKVRRVFVIGDEVPWLKVACNIPCKNTGKSREHRIFNKLAIAARLPEVSTDFLMMNDDHFILRQATTFPNWYDGSLEEKYAYRFFKDGYTRSMGNTLQAMKLLQRPTKHFDVHTPIVYNKKKLLELETAVDWELSFGYVIKSLYCNYHNLPGEFANDCKLNSNVDIETMRRAIEGQPVFSIGDRAFPQVRRLLEELYPDKSRYEN